MKNNMTDPLGLQRRNMIEYQQIDNQGNELFKKNGKSKMPDYLNNLFMEEYKEGQEAKQESNEEKLADASGDMLICIAGGIIQHKIPIECMKNLNSKPFKKDNISVIQPVEKVIARLNEATTPFEKAVLFENLWFGVVNEAIDSGFDIEGIYNAIAENNLARILRDENGDPITDENEKIMRKNMHPDLKPFIL
jgi:hypothetical protein